MAVTFVILPPDTVIRTCTSPRLVCTNAPVYVPSAYFEELVELELELELELVELELLDALSEDVAVPDPLLEELSAAVADAELVASGVSAVGLKKSTKKLIAAETAMSIENTIPKILRRATWALVLLWRILPLVHCSHVHSFSEAWSSARLQIPPAGCKGANDPYSFEYSSVSMLICSYAMLQLPS